MAPIYCSLECLISFYVHFCTNKAIGSSDSESLIRCQLDSGRSLTKLPRWFLKLESFISCRASAPPLERGFIRRSKRSEKEVEKVYTKLPVSSIPIGQVYIGTQEPTSRICGPIFHHPLDICAASADNPQL
ncbi:unnamed protein product [Calypogeia fissa]